ncbi:MAG: arsenosugar biosynthesis radical SAM protein ArsS [Desulfobacteraceae bacterium]|nr:arsenosugar biosynthesis radical SAM protein ArsS [Desulfobacteraceae bacterium]
MESFNKTLGRHNLKLTRGHTSILQINAGLLCNQKCRHCHLEAGPDRKENMDGKTARQVAAYAERGGFDTIDITGGAPELNPHLEYLVDSLSQTASQIMLRSNLSALGRDDKKHLIKKMASRRVTIVASFPSLDEPQTNAQRGDGVFKTSIEVLQKLNHKGYGQKDTGLELNLVVNPTGAFLPPAQEQSAKRFREILQRRWGIAFNRLHSFANVPMGRFRKWLAASGNLEAYMEKLANAFNPCALEGVMCRSLLSVSWDGYLYDCDFNLARRIAMGGGKKVHVSEMPRRPETDAPIATADYCYTCTAGAGFT